MPTTCSLCIGVNSPVEYFPVNFDILVFFFKQKTAYEISTWLEFRRVLFRSDLAAKTDAQMNAIFGWKNEAKTVGVLVRSEERRVGEECRSRWSAYLEKKD